MEVLFRIRLKSVTKIGPRKNLKRECGMLPRLECYPGCDQIFASYYQFSEFVEFPCLRGLSSKARASFLERQIEIIKWFLFWPIPFVLSKVLCTDSSLTGCGGFIQNST